MHPDRRKTVAERVGNRSRIASARAVWIVFHCASPACPEGHLEVYGSPDAAAKAVGSCGREKNRCRMEKFVPASMRRAKRAAPTKGSTHE